MLALWRSKADAGSYARNGVRPRPALVRSFDEHMNNMLQVLLFHRHWRCGCVPNGFYHLRIGFPFVTIELI